MNNIPSVEDWKRIFIDTSFIIDSIRDIEFIDVNDAKYESVRKTHALIEHFKLSEANGNDVIWVTSSIVLSELSKFENKDAVGELQMLFNSPNMEIINFTRKEASFLVNDITNYIEQKHFSRYVRELQKSLSEKDVFNPKNYISNDALIIACAKSKTCDVVLTSDEQSFKVIAQQVHLPILLSKDLPVDTFGNIDYTASIKTNY